MQEINKNEPIRGYKVFNPDWTCRNKQYTCPGIFEEDVNPHVCSEGMHFCRIAADCFNYYRFDSSNKVAEVVAYGDIEENGDKCCTNKLEIIREIPWDELLKIVNTGYGNTGNRNTGDWNTGYRNTGDWNTGNGNTGNGNTGDWNTGNRNTGDWNTGDWNKTNFSSGCFNTVEQKIYLFNKPSEWTYKEWLDSRAYDILCRIPSSFLKYVWFNDMTDEEKNVHPEAEITGGYIKREDNTPQRQSWWDGLDQNQKNTVTSLPNFDPDIFKEITGIDVNKN